MSAVQKGSGGYMIIQSTEYMRGYVAGLREAAEQVKWNCAIEVVDIILARAAELESQ